jgi:hypothetical protein
MPDDHPIADGTVEKGADGSTQVRFVRRLPTPSSGSGRHSPTQPSSTSSGATPTST